MYDQILELFFECDTLLGPDATGSALPSHVALKDLLIEPGSVYTVGEQERLRGGHNNVARQSSPAMSDGTASQTAKNLENPGAKEAQGYDRERNEDVDLERDLGAMIMKWLATEGNEKR